MTSENYCHRQARPLECVCGGWGVNTSKPILQLKSLRYFSKILQEELRELIALSCPTRVPKFQPAFSVCSLPSQPSALGGDKGSDQLRSSLSSGKGNSSHRLRKQNGKTLSFNLILVNRLENQQLWLTLTSEFQHSSSSIENGAAELGMWLSRYLVCTKLDNRLKP